MSCDRDTVYEKQIEDLKERLHRAEEDRDRLASEAIHLRAVSSCSMADCKEPIVHAFCLWHLHREREAAKRMIEEKVAAEEKLRSIHRAMLGGNG